MKKLGFAAALVGVVALGSIVAMYAVAGGGKDKLRADVLTGYQESAPAAISTTATGTFSATIDEDSQTINFEETYSGLSTPATQSHIHFGNRNQNGGISAFLCGPQPQAGNKGLCPAGDTADTATVTGTITPTDVVGPTGQGISPGEWQKLVDALRAGVAYANVHSTRFPAGEIRAQINDKDQQQPAIDGPEPNGHDDDDDHDYGHGHGNGHGNGR
jgi:hypothetical protein